jgi:hypothetical protein
MFQQKERVADEILFARRNDMLLDGESFRVRNTPESEKVNMHR